MEFKQGIITCYGRENFVTLQKKFLKTQMSNIIEGLTSCLNHVVMACVVNQSHGHWLLFDVVNYCHDFSYQISS